MSAAPGDRLRRVLPAVVAAAALALAGCSGDGSNLNDQMRQGDELGYIAGDGRYEQLGPDQRDTTITLYGTTLEEEEWHSEDALGQVLVVNVWGSWCGPCIAEAPDLEEVATGYRDAGEPVEFVGVNVRDSIPNALAFQNRFDVSYPSLYDDGGRTLALLQGFAVARPTTLILDGEGRLAARVNGQVSAATLRALVDDVLASEPSR